MTTLAATLFQSWVPQKGYSTASQQLTVTLLPPRVPRKGSISSSSLQGAVHHVYSLRTVVLDIGSWSGAERFSGGRLPAATKSMSPVPVGPMVRA